MSHRRTASALFAVAAAVTALVAVPSSAEAVAAGSCKATAKATFTPGLSLTQQVVKSKVTAGKVTGCTGPVAPTATATFTGTLKSTAAGQSCVAGTAKGTLTIKWSNGQITKVAVTQTPDTSTTTPFDIIIAGKATSGPGTAQNATLSAKVALTPTAGTCLTSPLTAANFAGNINITTP